jgi:hypothetical protein
MSNWFSRIPDKYWAYLALAFWGALSFMLLDKIPYGIDEGAARALLLVWSVVDNVVSPIVTSGLPDFRTIFLAPFGFLWTGNVLAAKIATILFMSGAVWLIHTWRQLSGNSESALLSSGLLLVSPLLIDQIDTVSVAPYLLLTFALGAWSDKIYREAPLVFGGMYFAQMFLCLISTSFHPAGIAYPLALLWTWYKTPVGKQQKYFFGGIIFSVLFALLLTQGWHHIEWFTNPIKSLSSLFSGSSVTKSIGAFRWISGVGIAIVLLWVVWKQAGNLWGDLLGRILLVALVLGMLAGDDAWAIVALAICFYWGFPLLLRTSTNSAAGFLGQRWVTMSLLFVISTSFMFADKAHYHRVQEEELTPRGSLLKALVENTKNHANDDSKQDSLAKKPLIIASQWPGLTMLACQCGTFPLPPTAKDGQALLAMLRGVNYLIFDPRDPKNSSLSQTLSLMDAGKVETIALEDGGVIVEIKQLSADKVEK